MRGWRAVVMLACAAVATFGFAAGATAQVSDDLGVIGQLQYDDANGVKQFAVGVVLSIDDVGGATTDAEGKFRIPVPAAAPTTSRSTLPRCPKASGCATQNAAPSWRM